MENIMLDKITETEYLMMHSYRKSYAWQCSPKDGCDIISIRTLLSLEWAKAKQDLFKLFGNELILHKGFEFEKAIEELSTEIYEALEYNYDSGRVERDPKIFYRAYLEWIKTAYPYMSSWMYGYSEASEEKQSEYEKNEEMAWSLRQLVNTQNLAKNSYEDKTFTLALADGKEYTVHNGCKPMKALAKIANSFNLPGFEDFRICHSQIHNQKKLKGELTISIHPFDYWTMSDNDCDWDSCMNWRETGGYRAGTVEMMNSPYVVVAYLASKEPMKVNGGEWNNKKWRQLFIVNKDVIYGIKDYPYHNENISKCVAMWLRDLAKENMGWEYTTSEPINWKETNSFVSPNNPEKSFRIGFSTNNMYNDTGTNHYHPIFVGTETGTYTEPDQWRSYIDINYSGKGQCVSCGYTKSGCLDGDASALCCSDCESVVRCVECGTTLYEDEIYYYKGHAYCCDCYWDFMSRCENCESEVPSEDIVCVHLLTRDTLTPFEEGDKIKIRDLYRELYYCYDCFRGLPKEALKPGCSIIKYSDRYGYHNYGIFIEDINEDSQYMIPYRHREALNSLRPESRNDPKQVFHALMSYGDEDTITIEEFISAQDPN